MEGSVKYYIYISDTKVDMLYSQIPRPLLKRIASELNISLNLFGVEVGAAIKGDQSEEARYSKLRIVVQYIEKKLNVGTVDAPKTYFKGDFLMQYGPILDSGIIYFGGSTRQTALGLGGSLQHVLGSTASLQTQAMSPPSSIPSSILDPITAKLNDFVAKIRVDSETYNLNKVLEPIFPGSDALKKVEFMTKIMSGPQQKVEFLAKTLLQGSVQDHNDVTISKHVVLGSPLYVALAD